MKSTVTIEKCCYYCDGTGISGQEDGSKCFSCGGSGLAKDQDKLRVICDNCMGDGYQDYTLRSCYRCKGMGWHYKSENDRCELDRKFSRNDLYLITSGEGLFTISSKYEFTKDVNVYLDEGMYKVFPSKRKKDGKIFQVVKFEYQGKEYYFPCFRKCNEEDGVVIRSLKVFEDGNEKEEIRVCAIPQ